MVVQDGFDGRLAWQCEECELHFVEKQDAVDCEVWCSEHESCNYAVASKSLEASG